MLKSDIEIGPVYHRLPQRIRSHALVCFMALMLYRVMRMRLAAAKRSESPATLLEQLKRIHRKRSGISSIKTFQNLPPSRLRNQRGIRDANGSSSDAALHGGGG